MIDASKFALDLMAAVGIISLRADAAKIISQDASASSSEALNGRDLTFSSPTH